MEQNNQSSGTSGQVTGKGQGWHVNIPEHPGHNIGSLATPPFHETTIQGTTGGERPAYMGKGVGMSNMNSPPQSAIISPVINKETNDIKNGPQFTGNAPQTNYISPPIPTEVSFSDKTDYITNNEGSNNNHNNSNSNNNNNSNNSNNNTDDVAHTSISASVDDDDDDDTKSVSTQTSVATSGPVLDKNGRIPRPKNSFMLYRMDQHSVLKAKHPKMNNKDISVMVGEMWRKESDEVKAKYKKRADDDKERHKQLYPDYKYVPLNERSARGFGKLKGHANRFAREERDKLRKQYKRDKTMLTKIKGSIKEMLQHQNNKSETRGSGQMSNFNEDRPQRYYPGGGEYYSPQYPPPHPSQTRPPQREFQDPGYMRNGQMGRREQYQGFHHGEPGYNQRYVGEYHQPPQSSTAPPPRRPDGFQKSGSPHFQHGVPRNDYGRHEGEYSGMPPYDRYSGNSHPSNEQFRDEIPHVERFNQNQQIPSTQPLPPQSQPPQGYASGYNGYYQGYGNNPPRS